MFYLRHPLLFVLLFKFVNSQCPLDILIEPCSCSHRATPNNQNISQRTIVCEHIDDLAFDLQSIFIKLSLIDQTKEFHSFSLQNTSIKHLPGNVFVNVQFENLIFRNNFRLTTIDRNAFSSTANRVQSFETLNTNLSDSEQLFSIIRQFSNLRFLSLQNDRLKFIPSQAFNHTYLSHIYFGFEYTNQTQPIESIGDYAFYHLPSLHFVRLFSPNLSRISKYAFAQEKRNASDMLEFYLGGRGINSTSFELTSLNRFRNRFVFLRLFDTNISYLDEHVFQPFLESNPSSLIDIGQTKIFFNCSCQSAWIQKDYFPNQQHLENRVYGYPCWDYDFTKDCMRNK